MREALLEYGDKKYILYENGEILDVERNKFLKQGKDSCGYVVVNLGKGKNRVKRTIHRLLGINFIPNPYDIPISELTINHKDFNKDNNSLSNLEWMTRGENARDSYRQPNHLQRGSTNYNAKLTEEQVKIIKSKLNEYTDKELGEEFGVNYRTIYDIRTNKTWKHIK